MPFFRFILRFAKNHKLISALVFIGLISLLFFFLPKKTASLQTQVVSRGDIRQTLSETGTVDAQTTVNLSFLTSGKLVFLGAKKGDRVSQGQVIASLDTYTLQRNLELEANAYKTAKNNNDQTQENLQAGIAEGQQRLSLDTANKNAYSNITEAQVVTDTVKRLVDNSLLSQNTAQLNVDLANYAVQMANLTSPINGIVTRADAQSTGINIGTNAVFTIADPDNLVFDMDVDEADIGSVHIGQQVSINLDPYPEKTLQLTVDKIDFSTHPTATGGDAYTVQATLPVNNDLDFRIGMNGDAEILLTQKKNAITVPLSCVENNRSVYLKTKKGFRKQAVALGIRNDTDAEVISGLNVGDQIALDPAAAAKIAKN